MCAVSYPGIFFYLTSKYMKRLFILALAFVSFNNGLVNADVASMGGDGNTLVIMDNASVKMVGESIKLEVTDQKRLADGYGWSEQGAMDVNVYYTFRNMSDQPVKVKMGFPENCGGDCVFESTEYVKPENPSQESVWDFYKLMDFSARVGDEKVDIVFVKGDEKNWYTFEVDFLPGEEKLISNQYWVVPRTYKGHMDYSYILETGASWADDIEFVNIYLSFLGELNVKHLSDISLQGYRFDPVMNAFVWNIYDLEPQENLNFSVSATEIPDNKVVETATINQKLSEDIAFTDLIKGHKNFEAVKYLKGLHIIQGYANGTFKPDGLINRAEIMKIIVEKQVGLPGANYNNCFKDVKEEWFAPYICFAKEQGWVSGYADGNFMPGQSVNRAEAIKIMLNIYYGKGWQPSVGNYKNEYTDVDSVEWYYPYFAFAAGKGVLDLQHVLGDLYFPGANMTRKEVAQMLYNLMML